MGRYWTKHTCWCLDRIQNSTVAFSSSRVRSGDFFFSGIILYEHCPLQIRGGYLFQHLWQLKTSSKGREKKKTTLSAPKKRNQLQVLSPLPMYTTDWDTHVNILIRIKTVYWNKGQQLIMFSCFLGSTLKFQLYLGKTVLYKQWLEFGTSADI